MFTLTRRRGQVLIMVTLALFSMLGLTALAVDLGLAYFDRKSAQTAADAAALAAVIDVYKKAGPMGTLDPCPAGVANNCAAVADRACPASITSAGDNLDVGCLYAAKNYFADGARGGNQVVKLDAAPGNPPHVPGVHAKYWVRARVSDARPTLFAGIFGQSSIRTGANATAAIAGVIVEFSLLLTNRSGDWSPNGTGVNINVNSGAATVTVPGGIVMASNAKNSPLNAGISNSGQSSVLAAYTWIRETDARNGWVDDPGIYKDLDGAPQPPENRFEEGPLFQDYEAGKGQPAVPTSDVKPCPIPGGLIDGSSVPLTLAPGDYYAVDSNYVPTGGPIIIKGTVHFASSGSGASCFSGTTNTGVFGSYVFYGGFTNQGGNAAVTVEPGRYFVAGAMPKNNGDPNMLMDLSSNMTMVDTAGANTSSYPGEIFVLTDPRYPPLVDRVATLTGQVPGLAAKLAEMKQGPTNLQAGSGTISLNLHGLNPEDAGGLVKTAGLDKFERILFWQDQRNSTVDYDGTGNIACGAKSESCLNSDYNTVDGVDSNYKSTQFSYQGSATSVLEGIIYQPRGANMVLQGGNTSADLGKLQIITGSIKFGGNSSIAMRSPDPIMILTVALIQ